MAKYIKRKSSCAMIGKNTPQILRLKKEKQRKARKKNSTKLTDFPFLSLFSRCVEGAR